MLVYQMADPGQKCPGFLLCFCQSCGKVGIEMVQAAEICAVQVGTAKKTSGGETSDPD
jgi:hypothetical protein